VAKDKRRSFAEQSYWGRPVPGFGSITPRVLIVGLAPAAHGANRTGRMFTGDRSGDWLYASLHRVGLANQPTSVAADDGLRLTDARVTAAVRCAPPENKPTTVERDTCSPWLDAEFSLVSQHVRAIVALGSFAFAATLSMLSRVGHEIPRPRPKFGHGVEVDVGASAGRLTAFGCYHPSQQNTFTGKLTEPMLDEVLRRAASSGRSDGQSE
jgi:uracil-DNA glycosylase family 4